MPNPERNQIFVGARARLLIGGKQIGWATGCDGDEEYMLEPVDVLDNIETEEHATVGYRVNWSFAHVTITTVTLRGMGLLPKLGANPQAHLANILRSGELALGIEDNQSRKLMFQLQRAKFARNSFSVGARAVSMRNCNGVAIRLLDASEA
jgi:hypothetical protein